MKKAFLANSLSTGKKIFLVILPLMFLCRSLHAQTFVTGPMTGTPLPGDYYHNVQVSAEPRFKFTPTAGQHLKLYIDPSCGILKTIPSATMNYITTSTPRIAAYDPTKTDYTTCQLMQAVQYFDGLGRLLQTVQVRANPNSSKDVIQPAAYDEFGRQVTKYLPYSSGDGNAGSYRADAVTGATGYGDSKQKAFYGLTNQNYATISTPFAATNFEPSPLNRAIEQGASGDDWQIQPNFAGHTVKTAYSNNNTTVFTDTANTTRVALYIATVNSNKTRTLSRANNNAFYDDASLRITITKDENWHSGRGGTVEEYKDKDGHVVLKRTFNYIPGTPNGTLQMISTYYVYDDLGNLAFVLPPGVNPDDEVAISGTKLNDLCYQYRYDERNRLIQKKIPGKGWQSMVYNKFDQLVLFQDAVQAAVGVWNVIKYDALGRAVITGLWADAGQSLSSLQNSVNISPQWDVRDYTDNLTGYNILSYANPTVILTINYYDDYTNIPGLPTGFVIPSGASAMTKGLLTATKTGIVNNHTDFLWQALFYDDLGRNIKSYQQHYLGGVVSNNNYDEIVQTFDFSNEVTNTTRLHHTAAASGNAAVTINNDYTYDQLGRKTGTWEQLQNYGQTADTRIMLSQLQFNEVGQVWKKRLDSPDGVFFQQVVKYSYNERGWLNKSEAPLFEEQLVYNTGAVKQYNGNIAYQSWGTSAAPDTKTYSYTYDLLNRLTSGISTDNYAEKNITYDQMGNIKTLDRYFGSATSPIDQLSYNYLNGSNPTYKLLRLTDNSGDNAGVKAGGPYIYVYDLNGNVTTDPSRSSGTTNIAYNYLNLPQSISGAKTITYFYDANGVKQRRASAANGATDYISGIQYDGVTTPSLTFIATEDGRVIPNGTSHYDYQYNLEDHLGNNRVMFTAKSTSIGVLQVDDYLPFGMEVNKTPTTPNLKNEYLYNGKELQEEFGQYDYGARFFDPVIARWNVIDPLTETNRAWSVYVYVKNSPVRLIDPDGMKDTDGPYGTSLADWEDSGLARGNYQNLLDDGGKNKKPGYISTFLSTNSNKQTPGESAAATWEGWVSENSTLPDDLSDAWDSFKRLFHASTWENKWNDWVAYFNSSPEYRATSDRMMLDNFLTGYITVGPVSAVAPEFSFGTKVIGAEAKTLFSFEANGGYGIQLGNIEFMYNNPNVKGGTIFAYEHASGFKLRLDYHSFKTFNNPLLHFHTNFRGLSLSTHRSLNPLRFGKAIGYK